MIQCVKKCILSVGWRSTKVSYSLAGGRQDPQFLVCSPNLILLCIFRDEVPFRAQMLSSDRRYCKKELSIIDKRKCQK